MKASSSPVAATALSALYAKDGRFVERSLGHLTPSALGELDKRLLLEFSPSDAGAACAIAEDRGGGRSPLHLALARACVRRRAHECIGKYAVASRHSRGEVEEALKFHELPPGVRLGLASSARGGGVVDDGGGPPPANWHEELERLRRSPSGRGGGGGLWRLVCDHPMTSYVPVQCRSCGLVVPDEYPPVRTDAEVGLEEVPPAGDELELRSGWFRGPRGAVAFRLTCPDCGHVTDWYRSGHPRIILDPNGRGRLCGEQEDLRLMLAGYLNVPVRLVVPLDWDHVWTEYDEGLSSPSPSSSYSWQVHDGDARNFCRRLNEGIGSWTGVWAIHPDPDLCEDVTSDYLTCCRDGGRADDNDDDDDDGMGRYKDAVRMAREDPSGGSTQSKTVYGYALSRAGLSYEDITSELKLAARDYGTKGWWQLHDS